MNRWNIPDGLEREVIARDTCCVYCGKPFVSCEGARRSRASWEHIINDARIVTRANIALCCIGCNASKGTKTVELWFSSEYCKLRGISANTVAAVVREALSEGSKKTV